MTKNKEYFNFCCDDNNEEIEWGKSTDDLSILNARRIVIIILSILFAILILLFFFYFIYEFDIISNIRKRLPEKPLHIVSL